MPYEFSDPAETKLTLRVEGPKQFSVVHGFVYRDMYNDDKAWNVPPSTGTDLASVPFFLQWLVLSYGKHTNAAIVHDVFWDEDKSLKDLREANTVFRHGMWESGVPWLRRWFMWTAVTLAMLTMSKKNGLPRVLIWAVGLVTSASALFVANDIVLSWDVFWWTFLASGVLAILAALFWALGSKAMVGIVKKVVIGLAVLAAVLALFSFVGHNDWVADHAPAVAIGALAVALLMWWNLIVAGLFATVEVAVILLPVAAISLGILVYGILEIVMWAVLWVGRKTKEIIGWKPVGTLNWLTSSELEAPPPPANATAEASQT